MNIIPTGYSCLRRLLTLLLLLLSPCLVAEPTATRFQRTVDALQLADDSLRGRFATIALLQLAEVYMAEADLARREAGEEGAAAKLQGWSRAVDKYAAQLVLVLDDIELGFPVELRNNPREVPSVAAGGRVVMLAHPRRGQQPLYEQAVLREFCTGDTCARLTAELEGHQPIPVSAVQVKPRWEFGPGGPVCSHRGLSLYFTSGGDLATQRSLCKQLVQEVEALATELGWQQRHGVEIDWGELSSRAVPGKPVHVVQLNGAGEAILLPLPLLNSTPGLLPGLAPWLEKRHLRDGEVELGFSARDLGWE